MQSLTKGNNIGELAEWSNAAVLKTVDLNGSGGSNPSLSAEKSLQVIEFQSCRLFLCPKSCTKNAPNPVSTHFYGCFSNPIYPILLIPFYLSSRQHEMWRVIFLPFQSKRCTEKGNHLRSSLLKIVFHKQLPFLASDSKIWSQCFEILVSSICSNLFFCPTTFRTMNDKSSSRCVCRNDVAYLRRDVSSLVSAILCYIYLPCYS